MPESVNISKLTVPIQVLIGVITSTAIVVYTININMNSLKDEIRKSDKRIDQTEANQKFMELKYEYLKIDVEKLKMDIEKDRTDRR